MSEKPASSATSNSVPSPSTATSNPPALPRPLTNLLSTLDIQRLGEGSLHAGANVLLAMCNTLCVLEGPESGIIDAVSGTSYPAGANLLSTDPKTNRLIRERVLKPVQQLQAVHLNHIRALRSQEERLNQIRDNRGLATPREHDETLRSLEQRGAGAIHSLLASMSDNSAFFRETKAERASFAASHPHFFVAGTDPKQLECSLAEAHLGHVLIGIQFARIEEVVVLDPILNGLITGSYQPRATKHAPLPGHVGGGVMAIVTEPIRDALCDPGLCSATWQTRVVWLPSLLKYGPNEISLPEFDGERFDLIARFGDAVRRVLNTRLAGEKPVSVERKDFYKAHSNLSDAIGRTPHLAQETREHFSALLATLCRGLNLMFVTPTTRWPKGVSLAGMTLLSQLIAINSVRIRRSAEQRLRIAHKREEALRIYEKLADGPQTLRELCRRFDRLAAADCLAALQQLQEWGLVTHEDGRWLHAGAEGNPRRIIETSAIEIR